MDYTVGWGWKLMIKVVIVFAAIAIPAVIYLPDATGWAMRHGQMSIQVAMPNGEVWTQESVGIGAVRDVSADTCSSPHRGRIVVVSKPVEQPDGTYRVGVAVLTAVGTVYEIEYGGWISGDDSFSPSEVALRLAGDTLALDLDAAFISGGRTLETTTNPERVLSLWVMGGNLSTEGPGVMDSFIDLMPIGAQISRVSLLSRTTGAGSIALGLDMRWQATWLWRDMIRLFC